LLLKFARSNVIRRARAGHGKESLTGHTNRARFSTTR